MKYKTEQKIKLYDFLKSHPHDYFTVKEIVDEIAKTNSCMSVSTIYRHLSELINCGKVKKSYRLNDREALYRYIDSDICRNEIHLTCSVCGEVFHLNHEISDLLKEKLANEYGFQLDNNKTVISGICKKCAEKKAQR